MRDKELIESPTEGLNTELKRWIDPTQPAGIEKIVKATLALRNRNGGFLVVGFDNSTYTPDVEHEPTNPKELFHVDLIQGIVSKYASDLFEIELLWGEREGRQYPVVVVPSGVRVPVAAKRDLLDGTRTSVRNGAVYFRSLASNGTPSSTEARASDWSEIIEICFDNREAEVGRFIRRHLSGVDVLSLLSHLGQPTPVALTLCDKAYKLIDDGENRFQEAVESRNFSPEKKKLLDRGFWSVGLVIDPPKTSESLTREFLTKIRSSNPEYTGWPIWRDTSYFSDIEAHPRAVNGAFEYLVVSSGFSDHVDFARFDPKGEFFLHRFLPDEVAPSQIAPGEAIDPTLTILRVAEALGVGIAFAKTLGWAPDETTLCFAFRWHNLKGRRLMTWSNPYSFHSARGVAYDPTVQNCVQFSLDTPLSALAQFVDEATRPLFAAFDGATMQLATIEDLVKRLFERRVID